MGATCVKDGTEGEVSFKISKNKDPVLIKKDKRKITLSKGYTRKYRYVYKYKDPSDCDHIWLIFEVRRDLYKKGILGYDYLESPIGQVKVKITMKQQNGNAG